MNKLYKIPRYSEDCATLPNKTDTTCGVLEESQQNVSKHCLQHFTIKHRNLLELKKKDKQIFEKYFKIFLPFCLVNVQFLNRINKTIKLLRAHIHLFFPENSRMSIWRFLLHTVRLHLYINNR